jgi:hypothetical protein
MIPLKLQALIKSDSAFIRNLADCLRPAIEEVIRSGYSEIQVDCAGIRFVSRAFAHEILCLVRDYLGRGARITLINLDSQVETMLNKVQSSYSMLSSEKPARPELYPKMVSFEEAQKLF